MLSRGLRPSELVPDIHRYSMQAGPALREQVCGGVGVSVRFGHILEKAVSTILAE